MKLDINNGELINICSRPGVGKTTLIRYLISNMLKRNNDLILYESLDMSVDEEHDRISEIVNDKDIVSKRLIISDDIKTINELDEYLDENSKIKLVVIDYLQLMKDKNSGSIVELKQMALKYNIAIIVLNEMSIKSELNVSNYDLTSDKLIYLNNSRKQNDKNYIDIQIFNKSTCINKLSISLEELRKLN